MFDGANTVVLFEELAFQDVLPVTWHPLPAPVDAETASVLAERNVRLLQAREAMDQLGPVESTDEDSPHAAALIRLELKVNLVLDLVGQILASNHPRPAAVPIRFNSLGATWRSPGTPLPEAGGVGLVEIYLHECLAEPLKLAARIASVTPDGHIKARFAPVGETVADLLEKLAFRRHRRLVAGSRQPTR
ncbi:MAG: PilZ domain-containing protein [Proteobacteria bacterium]|nr:PilZ domain-containing protein [Pseudomonadota bacterium]